VFIPGKRGGAAGWILLLVGVVATGIGVVLFWTLWDVPPEDVRQRNLLLPFVVGLPALGFGLYLVITGKPLEKDDRGRYPHMFKGPRRTDDDPRDG
jgi:hypothetical protein